MRKSSQVETTDEVWAEGACTVRDAVAFLGVGRTHLFKLMSQGKIQYVKSGARRLIPKRALVQYLQKLTR